MKKVITIALSLLLLLSLLTACGGSDKGNDDPLNRPGGSASSPASDPTNNPTDSNPVINVPDLSSIIGGTGKLSDYDAATRQAMIDAAKEDGCNLEFKADGSVVFTDEEGNVMIQHPDGTWMFQDDDGSVGQIGGDWPDNEFTRLVPKPEFTLMGATTSADDFSVAFSGATVEQVKEYAEQLKVKGFTVDPETDEQNVMGMKIFVYSAKNADGYKVEVNFASGVAGLMIEKP